MRKKEKKWGEKIEEKIKNNNKIKILKIKIITNFMEAVSIYIWW